MGTIELAIISGLQGSESVGSSLLVSANNQVGYIKFETWLERMCSALSGIEKGLGKQNRCDDKIYYRRKITGILLAKALEGCDKLMPTTSTFDKQFHHLDSLIPQLALEDFFQAIYHFGLFPEFAEYLLEMKDTVCNVILDKLFNFLSSAIEGNNTLTVIDGLVIASSILISVSLVINEKHHDHDTELFFTSSKDIFERLLPVLQLPDESIKSCLTGNHTCLLNMLINLHSLANAALKNASQQSMGLLDALHLKSISQTLTSFNIENIGRDDGGKENLNLLENLSSMHAADRSNALKVTFVPVGISDCIDLAVKCLASFHSQDIIFRDLTTILLSIQSLNSNRDVRSVDSFAKDKEEVIEKYTLEHMVCIIQHHLHGYEIIVEELLRQIIKNPMENNLWRDAFKCFEITPECLAVTKYLILILEGVSKCYKVCCSKSRDEFIYVACMLQKAFWTGYGMLGLNSKIKITKSIICDEALCPLISEYPLKKFEKDSSKIQQFYHRRGNKIKSFFDSLVSKASANKSVIENACEICILWPKGTVQKLVDQAIKNEQQIEILVNILRNLQCLFEIKENESTKSVLWSCFYKSIVSHCRNGDVVFVENGLQFFHTLVKADKGSASEQETSFLKEAFKDVIASYSSDHMENFRLRRLCLKLFSCLLDAHIVFETMTTSQLVVLCLCLGANMDRSRHFWNSSSNFDHEEHELLVECFEYLIRLTADDLKNEDETILNQHTEWVARSIGSFAWTTQLRYSPVLKLNDQCKVEVPASLTEVCTIPEMLLSSEKVSYGPGTGLLAWHQCFVINPSLCPLTSLDIEYLSPAEVKLFSDGWIVTLAQVLPFCLSHEWHTLIEASKVFLNDSKLHVPIISRNVIALPVIDISECSVILGIMWILVRVSELLAKECCVGWTSPNMWLHFAKCYCTVVSRLVNDSAEFAQAVADSQLFMLSQMFCCICGFIKLLSDLPADTNHPNSQDNVFILALDIVGTFEKIHQKINNKYLQCYTELEKEEVADLSIDSFSDKSSQIELPDCSHLKITLEIFERLNEMLRAASYVPVEEYSDTLTQKLTGLMQSKDG